MNAKTILVDCEGSAQPPAKSTTQMVFCAMCSNWWPPLPFGDGVVVVPYHQRIDVTAMIDRGDWA